MPSPTVSFEASSAEDVASVALGISTLADSGWEIATDDALTDTLEPPTLPVTPLSETVTSTEVWEVLPRESVATTLPFISPFSTDSGANTKVAFGETNSTTDLFDCGIVVTNETLALLAALKSVVAIAAANAFKTS